MKTTYVTLKPDMARAYREKQKRMTRRVIKLPTDNDIKIEHSHEDFWLCGSLANMGIGDLIKCPYGQPGDQIILGTTWAVPEPYDDLKPTELRPSRYGDARRHDALNEGPVPIWSYFNSEEKPEGFGKLRPARFLPGFLRDRMPRETLKIVRAERLHDIIEEDAIAEGFAYEIHRITNLVKNWSLGHAKMPDLNGKAIDWFHALWDSINTARGYSWDSNPWVWVLGW